jgi:hypothetical protein
MVSSVRTGGTLGERPKESRAATNFPRCGPSKFAAMAIQKPETPAEREARFLRELVAPTAAPEARAVPTQIIGGDGFSFPLERLRGRVSIAVLAGTKLH